MSGDVQHKGSSSAARMRQSRQRRRDGFVGVIGIDLRQTEVAALIARGFLAAADRNDLGAIAAALGRLLDALL